MTNPVNEIQQQNRDPRLLADWALEAIKDYTGDDNAPKAQFEVIWLQFVFDNFDRSHRGYFHVGSHVKASGEPGETMSFDVPVPKNVPLQDDLRQLVNRYVQDGYHLERIKWGPGANDFQVVRTA